MIFATFFICGVRIGGPATGTIVTNGTLASPAMVEIWARDGGPVAVGGSVGNWTISLNEGDYVIRVTAPFDDSLPGDGTELVLAYSDPVLVGEQVATQTWTSAKASTGSDPKDPWPPPGAYTKIADTKWFQDTLATIEVVTPKSGPEPDRPARRGRATGRLRSPGKPAKPSKPAVKPSKPAARPSKPAVKPATPGSAAAVKGRR